jgi:hypothetical protein
VKEQNIFYCKFVFWFFAFISKTTLLLKRLTNTSKGRYQDNLQEKKISAKCTQATTKKNTYNMDIFWMVQGLIRSSSGL